MAKIEIKPLTSHQEIEKCIYIQKEVWGLDETGVTSPITLKALSALEPQMAIFRGGFVDGELVSFVLAMASLTPGTAYGHMMGVLEDYRELGLGVMLHENMLNALRNRGITTYTFTYEPLESRIAHMYINRAGAVATSYEAGHFSVNCDRHKDIPLDRFLAHIDLSTPLTPRKVEPLSDALEKYPLASTEDMPGADMVLVAIPADLQAAKAADFDSVLQTRLNTRNIFSEYLNNRNYTVQRLISGFQNEERQSYYLLERGA